MWFVFYIGRNWNMAIVVGRFTNLFFAKGSSFTTKKLHKYYSLFFFEHYITKKILCYFHTRSCFDMFSWFPEYLPHTIIFHWPKQKYFNITFMFPEAFIILSQ